MDKKKADSLEVFLSVLFRAAQEQAWVAGDE